MGLFLFLDMISFLESVIKEVRNEHTDYKNLVFVLPSKRSGFFLKNYMAKITTKTQLAPEIYSIETFVENISGLKYASNTEQLFELYNTYLKHDKEEKDNFYTFSKWGRTLLQDFNEIDHNLINVKKIFSHLSAIQEINHWYLQKEKSKMIQNYIRFWNNLEALYISFNSSLQEKGIAHRGLVYRKACDRLKIYLNNNRQKKHIFIGFNALNAAESYIIQEILEKTEADIFWNNDPYFIDDNIHAAGHFIRSYKKQWNYYKERPLKGIKDNYLTQKNINIIGVPKNVSQAKYVGNLLFKLKTSDPQLLKNTAIVLADETLLNPIINSIPKEIEHINITMGYPLQKTSLSSLFSHFFHLYIHEENRAWFYKNVLTFLSHPYIQILLTDTDKNYASLVSEEIKNKNLTYITYEKIQEIAKGCSFDIATLFYKENLSPIAYVSNCLKIILNLKTKFKKSKNTLALEYLYRFYQLFNQISELVKKHSFIIDLKSLQSLYEELLSTESLNFKGEPLEGLQIMGILESRNIDFETVIITSVNEGILPSGKSNNSFIPFDIKKAFGLPTHKEKDSIYTYHFYRLLQGAKNIYLVYNTEPDVLEGGEKSRLITQLLTDENKLKDITEIIAFPEITPMANTPQIVQKDSNLMGLIKTLSGKGFSPSYLANYIRNPIDFYKKSLLKIDEHSEVEETVAANTFGTIVHNTLEELYTPFIGAVLTVKLLNSTKPKIKRVVAKHFSKSYSAGDIFRGKNLIAYSVILRYIENFIDLEITEVKKSEIKILSLEENLKVTLEIPELDFPVILKGKLDRVDKKNGVTRIIDYKTGKVIASELTISDWGEITANTKFTKAFQLLCYALMYSYKHPNETVEAGIISFKNLKTGVLRFAQKENTKNHQITTNTIAVFYEELKKLIIEICSPEIPFTEEEI